MTKFGYMPCRIDAQATVLYTICPLDTLTAAVDNEFNENFSAPPVEGAPRNHGTAAPNKNSFGVKTWKKRKSNRQKLDQKATEDQTQSKKTGRIPKKFLTT